MTRRPIPFHAANRAVSHDTVEALEQLLDEARRGRLIGVTYVAMYKRREFVTNATGEAHRNPVFARGMISFLDDHLREVAHG